MTDPFQQTLEEYRAALDAQVEAAAAEERLDEARKKYVAATICKIRSEVGSVAEAQMVVAASDGYAEATDALGLARKALAEAKAKVKWLEKRFSVWEERSRAARAKQWRDSHGNAQTSEGPDYGQADGRC